MIALKRLSRLFSTQILHSQHQAFQLYKKYYGWKPKSIFSFYNSQFDRIILQQDLMLIPIDEKMITASHAVFDTIYIKNCKIINMQKHIERLFKSARSIEIEPCFTPAQVKEKIIDLTKATFESYIKRTSAEKLHTKIFALRLNFSAGHQSSIFQKIPSIFYAAIYESNIEYEKGGVKDFITYEVPTGITEFTHSKTVDYSENAMMATESKRRGGYQGIKCTKDKIILEASVANVAFVFPDRQFVTPRLETVIKGTTLMAVMKHLESEVKHGRWGSVVTRDITVEEAYQCQQMMIIGGDKIVPVLELDGNVLSIERGPLSTHLQEWYEQSIEQQEGILVQIDQD